MVVIITYLTNNILFRHLSTIPSPLSPLFCSLRLDLSLSWLSIPNALLEKDAVEYLITMRSYNLHVGLVVLYSW